MTKQLSVTVKGGSFLVGESAPEDVFTPEDFSEEQTMIRDMTEQFVEDEVVPQVDKIEHKDWAVTINLLKRCGELGLLGIEVPEKYGGENLDKVSAMIVAEKLARVASFAVSYGGHSGIGTLADRLFRQRRTQTKVSSAAVQGRKDLRLRTVRSRQRLRRACRQNHRRRNPATARIGS